MLGGSQQNRQDNRGTGGGATGRGRGEQASPGKGLQIQPAEGNGRPQQSTGHRLPEAISVSCGHRGPRGQSCSISPSHSLSPLGQMLKSYLQLIIKISRHSLAVWWLGLDALTAEGLGSIPGRGIHKHRSTAQKKKKKKISTSISQSLLLALQLTAALSFWLLSTEFKFLRYTERMSSSSRLQKQVSPRRETRNCTGHRNQQPSTGKHSTG